MANESITHRMSDDLRRQIQNGSLGPGALLPSEPELAREYNVSRQTARTALQALEQEGLVIVRPRRGRVVRSNQRLRWHLSEFERPDHTVLTTSDAWETDIEGQGHDPTRQDLEVERITPPDSIATRLNLDPRTDTVVVRRHVRYLDGRPAIISDDYFDERIVEGTELAEPEDTARENILAEAGYEQVYDIDEIITRMPTPAEVERLSISTGTPVAEHVRTGYTASNQAVRVMVSIVPGDTLILQYTIPT
jgi:DNA-binding GntR family transcriptional regulator